MTTRPRRSASSVTTWGALDAEQAGRALEWSWPWGEDAAGTLVRRVGLAGFDEDGGELIVHVVDYGGDVGEQPTQRRADAEVTLP